MHFRHQLVNQLITHTFDDNKDFISRMVPWIGGRALAICHTNPINLFLQNSWLLNCKKVPRCARSKIIISTIT